MKPRLFLFDSPILYKVCEPVPVEQEGAFQAARNLAQRMERSLKDNPSRRGVGLAAPQIGSAVRVIVIKPHEGLPGDWMINPEYVEKSGRMEIGDEACLSYPGYVVRVERHYSVRMKYVCGRTEKVRKELFVGWKSRIVQHEMDHLEGVCHVRTAWEKELLSRNYGT